MAAHATRTVRHQAVDSFDAVSVRCRMSKCSGKLGGGTRFFELTLQFFESVSQFFLPYLNG